MVVMAMFLFTSLLTLLVDIKPAVGSCISADCTECRDGYMGVNCSIKCRYPNFGKECQSFCNCLEEDCDAATGCANLANDSDRGNPKPILEAQETKPFQESSSNAGGPDNDKGFHLTPILISVVGVLCLVLAVITAKYVCMKHNIKNQTRDKNRMKVEGNQLQGLRDGQALSSEIRKENVYDELDEQKMDVDKKMKVEEVFEKMSGKSGYTNALEFKREKVSANRQSLHVYKSLKK